jgi:hypothetical protein
VCADDVASSHRGSMGVFVCAARMTNTRRQWLVSGGGAGKAASNDYVSCIR